MSLEHDLLYDGVVAFYLPSFWHFHDCSGCGYGQRGSWARAFGMERVRLLESGPVPCVGQKFKSFIMTLASGIEMRIPLNW